MSGLLAEVRTARRLPRPEAARAIRLAAGISQQRLADELKVNRVSIARWENGSRRPRGQLLEAYVDLLDALQEEIGPRG